VSTVLTSADEIRKVSLVKFEANEKLDDTHEEREKETTTTLLVCVSRCRCVRDYSREKYFLNGEKKKEMKICRKVSNFDGKL
jgi:hypothetical protein